MVHKTYAYNKRLQPVILSASTPSATVFSLSYDFHLGSGDNGNVWQIVNNRDNASRPVGTVSFTYDALNRIASAQTSGTDCTVMQNGLTKNWGNSYQMDAWGNLTGKTVTKCSAETLTAASNTKNQIATYCYDAAGNLLNRTVTAAGTGADAAKARRNQTGPQAGKSQPGSEKRPREGSGAGAR